MGSRIDAFALEAILQLARSLPSCYVTTRQAEVPFLRLIDWFRLFFGNEQEIINTVSAKKSARIPFTWFGRNAALWLLLPAPRGLAPGLT